MDILSNVASGITGNIAKAIIYVRDIKPGQSPSVEDGAKKAEEETAE